MNPPLLSVENLSVEFATRRGPARVLEQLSFALCEGETLGLVGESGSGKSVTSLSVMRLLPDTAHFTGAIHWRGKNLLTLSDRELQKIRGGEIAMIFQDPMTSLNPSFTVGFQLAEAITTHSKEKMSDGSVRERSCELLGQVGISDAAERLQAYPYQFSGGMAQRVMIAMALASRPKLLIADEPTTALDVTIQAQILDLLKSLQKQSGMALILISHDLGVVAKTTENLIVMYAGQAIEMGPTASVLRNPQHPYTKGLLACSPSHHGLSEFRTRLKTISGQVPDLVHRPPGCQFYARCDWHQDRCLVARPSLIEVPARSVDKESVGQRAARCVRVGELDPNEVRS